jgi:hypothetical protein
MLFVWDYSFLSFRNISKKASENAHILHYVHIHLTAPVLMKFAIVLKLKLVCGSYGKGRVFPVLNKVPHHEDVWGSGDIAPYS